jgi:hypothetical protein
MRSIGETGGVCEISERRPSGIVGDAVTLV